MAFQDPEWAEHDAKVALCNDTIPLIFSLDILCPWFWALPASLGSWLLELFMIVLLCLNVNKTKDMASKS